MNVEQKSAEWEEGSYKNLSEGHPEPSPAKIPTSSFSQMPRLQILTRRQSVDDRESYNPQRVQASFQRTSIMENPTAEFVRSRGGDMLSIGYQAELEFIDPTMQRSFLVQNEPQSPSKIMQDNSRAQYSYVSGTQQHISLADLLMDQQRQSMNLSVSRAIMIDRRGDKSGVANVSKITVIELNEPIQPPQNFCELMKGILMMKLAIVSLCASGILLKYHYTYNPLVTTYDMVFVRAFSQLVVSYLLCLKDSVNIVDIPQHQWLLVIIRAISGTITFFLFNSAVKLISLSKLAFLQNTSPIFATLIAFLFLGEIITKYELISMSICIAGVIVLVQPYGSSEQEQTANILGSLLVLINSFLNAVNYNLLRMMKEIHYAIGPFYYGICGTFVSMIFIMEQVTRNLGTESRLAYMDYVLFTLIGVTSALGALFKSLAFHFEKVSTLSMLKYTNLFYSLAADLLLFNSSIYLGECIGAFLILSSNFVVAFLKYKQVI